MTEFLLQMRRGLSKAAQEAERLGKIGRLRLEVANLQRRRGRALRRAGEAVYRLVGSGALAVPEEVDLHLAQAREFEAEMAVKRAESAALRMKPEAPPAESAAE
jgi:hypothetical protein